MAAAAREEISEADVALPFIITTKSIIDALYGQTLHAYRYRKPLDQTELQEFTKMLIPDDAFAVVDHGPYGIALVAQKDIAAGQHCLFLGPLVRMDTTGATKYLYGLDVTASLNLHFTPTRVPRIADLANIGTVLRYAQHLPTDDELKEMPIPAGFDVSTENIKNTSSSIVLLGSMNIRGSDILVVGITYHTDRLIHSGKLIGWNYGPEYWQYLGQAPTCFSGLAPIPTHSIPQRTATSIMSIPTDETVSIAAAAADSYRIDS